MAVRDAKREKKVGGGERGEEKETKVKMGGDDEWGW